MSNPADHNDVYENPCALVEPIDLPYSQILQKKSQHHQHEQIPLMKEKVYPKNIVHLDRYINGHSLRKSEMKDVKKHY